MENSNTNEFNLEIENDTTDLPIEQESIEQNPSEQNPSEQESSEQESSEQNPFEQESSEQNPSEQNPSEQESSEQNPSEQESSEQNPSEQESIEQNLSHDNVDEITSLVDEVKLLSSSISEQNSNISAELSQPDSRGWFEWTWNGKTYSAISPSSDDFEVYVYEYETFVIAPDGNAVPSDTYDDYCLFCFYYNNGLRHSSGVKVFDSLSGSEYIDSHFSITSDENYVISEDLQIYENFLAYEENLNDVSFLLSKLIDISLENQEALNLMQSDLIELKTSLEVLNTNIESISISQKEYFEFQTQVIAHQNSILASTAIFICISVGILLASMLWKRMN